MVSFRRLAFFVGIAVQVLAFCTLVAAQPTPLRSITYRLSMSRPVSHLFEVAIEIELPDERKDERVELQMPKWSPGRYAVFDFAKNVQEFRAVAGICPRQAQCKRSPRPVSRVDVQTWQIDTQGSS